MPLQTPVTTVETARTRAKDVAVPVAVALSVVAGVLVATQSRINSQLGGDLGAPLLGGLVSNTIGLAIIVAVVALRPPTRAALRQAFRTDLPWWRYCGGALGATLVAGAVIIVPHTGVAVFTIGLVAGQTVGGLLVDRAGLSPAGRAPVSSPRLYGAGLAIAAVVVAEAGSGINAAALPYVAAAAVIGVASAVQQALNGSVQQAAGDPAASVAVNFAVGTAVLILGYVIDRAGGGSSAHHWPGQWYLYLGGLLGVGVIACSVSAVRSIGVLRLTLAVIAGQLAASVVLDLVVPTSGESVTWSVLLGVVLTFLAVAIAGRRQPPPTRPRRAGSRRAGSRSAGSRT